MTPRSLLLCFLVFSKIFFVCCNDLVLGDREIKCVKYDDGNEPCPGSDNVFKITKELVDDEYGSYKFTFETPVKDCKPKVYGLNINRHINESRVSCLNPVTKMSNNVMNKIILNQTESNCSKAQGVFYYDYLFKGCYSILHDRFEYFWIENNHTLDDFAIKTPTMTCLNERPPEVHIDFDKKSSHKNKLNFGIEMFLSNFNNPETFVPNCTRKNESEEINQNQNKFRNKCTFNHVPEGNYTVIVELKNDSRTYGKSHYGIHRWSCSINVSLAKTSIHKQKSEPTPKLSISTISIIIIIIVIFVIFLIGWFIHKKITLRRKSIQMCDNVFSIDLGHMRKTKKLKGIYLIYARDCLPFMKVMENFRYLLKKMSGCEVYDVYDDTWYYNIAMSPSEWISSHLQDPDKKIILVATECADRLYKNLLYFYQNSSGSEEKYCPDIYRSPSTFDNFLTFSLKSLSFDMSPAQYYKIFVVRFPKFNKEKDYMTHINPFKRFDMPENFEVLIENIIQQKPIVIDDCEDTEDDQLITFAKPVYTKQTFEDSVKELNEFFKRNPTYLMKDIMTKELNVGPSVHHQHSLNLSETQIYPTLPSIV